jgi:hypothetical protein
MKTISVILNLLLITSGIYLLAKYGMEGTVDNFVLITLLFTTPIFNLGTFFIKNNENWLSLYFKRKALEEKMKIEKLKVKDGVEAKS